MQGSNTKGNLTTAVLIGGLLINHAEAISQTVDKLEFDGTVGIEYGYDSNVVVEEIDVTSSSSDSFLRLRGKGSATFRFDERHSASASLSISDKSYKDDEAFDLQTRLFSSGYKYKNKGYTLGVDYRHASADLGGNDFLTLTQISPSLSFFLSKQNFFRLAYTSIEKELDNNPTRNSDGDNFGIDYYFFRNGLNNYFISSVKYRQEEAQDDIFSFDSYQLRFAYKKRFEVLGYKSRLTLDVKYRQRDFEEAINPTINDFRADKRRTFGVNNEVELSDEITWLIDITHINNGSNLTGLDYQETIVSTGIEYQF